MTEPNKELPKEVQPCPFCGGQPKIKRNSRCYHDAKGGYTEEDYFIECEDCTLFLGNPQNHNEYGDVWCDFNTEQQAIDFWNKQPILEAKDKQLSEKDATISKLMGLLKEVFYKHYEPSPQVNEYWENLCKEHALTDLGGE